MSTDRRTVLALTGALLAGAAGCLGDDPDRTEDEPNENGNGNGTGDGFGEYDAPEFPQLELVTDPEIGDDALATQVRGNVAFSLDLLEELRADSPDENLFFSPYSVSVALAMTYAGARGETAAEMADALRYELEDGDLHPAFGALEAEFARRNEDGEARGASNGERTASASDDQEGDDGPAFQFTTANSLWGQDGYPFREDFLDLLEAYYGAGMQLVDFSGGPDEARRQINEWVEAQTNDRIEDLLPQNSIDASTKLVLTNAIYFVARWKYPFAEDETEPRTFTGLDGQQTDVETMHQSIEVPYAEVDGHQLVELPYVNDDTSMVIVLPADGEFEEFEATFTVDRLATMLGETSVPEVDLALPKFGVESNFSLVEVMRRLGMERAFGPGADFSGMTDDGDLFVSEIIHQSFVEVDERGTEAAAATAVAMEDSAPMEHVEMTVDRPFLFYIRDRPTETPLFVGRVVDGATLQEN
ncbi:serpin family protein [Natribaculum luteum]|uniref:Serpin family protein n=1 Tax=Natribaculum luteum TaxID=1586232 RepID=A0ABD5NVW8_9EURY|nr:serpin family protein [Natribaculum luteum]